MEILKKDLINNTWVYQENNEYLGTFMGKEIHVNNWKIDPSVHSEIEEKTIIKVNLARQYAVEKSYFRVLKGRETEQDEVLSIVEENEKEYAVIVSKDFEGNVKKRSKNYDKCIIILDKDGNNFVKINRFGIVEVVK